MKSVLLIYPPFCAPSVPPLGIASLASFLRGGGAQVHLLDLNVEAYDKLLSPDFPTPENRDTFSQRSLKALPMALSRLRGKGPKPTPENYREIISHLQRVLWLRTEAARGPRVTLGDFRHPRLSPLKTADLTLMATVMDLGPLSSWVEGRLKAALVDTRPDYVGISVQFLSQALPAMAIAGMARELSAQTEIIMGGALVSLWRKMGKPLELGPWVHRIIPGAGYKALAEMLDLRQGRTETAFVPDFTGLPLELYLSPERVVPFATSLGCYWGRCRFCPEGDTRGTLCLIDTSKVPYVLQNLSGTWNAPWIHITDSAIRPSVLKVLSESSLGLKWFGFARFQEILQDEKIARGLFDSGCRMLQLGLESASPRILGMLRKGIPPDLAKRTLANLHSAGIATYVYLIFGVPGETPEDHELTVEFLLENRGSLDFLHPSILNIPRWEVPPAGVEFVDFPGGEDKDLSLYWDFRPQEGMDRRSSRDYLHRVFLREPVLRELVKRDPPFFGPVHGAVIVGRGPKEPPFDGVFRLTSHPG